MGKKEITVYEFWRLTDYERDGLVRKKYGWGYDKFLKFCKEMLQELGPLYIVDKRYFYYVIEPEEIDTYFNLKQEETDRFEEQWLVENNASILYEILHPICKFLFDGWGLILMAFGMLFWFIYSMYQFSFNGLSNSMFLLYLFLGFIVMSIYMFVVLKFADNVGENHDKKLKQYLGESNFGKFRDSLYSRAYQLYNARCIRPNDCVADAPARTND